MISSNKASRSQRGMSLPAVLGLLVVIGFVALTVIKVLPIYMESMEIDSILSNIEDERSGQNASRADLRQAINKRLQVNSIRRVTQDDVTFNTVRDGTEILIQYEVRVPLLGNLDLVASFRKEAMVRQ